MRPRVGRHGGVLRSVWYSLDQSANAIIVVGKSEPRVHAACLVLASTRLDVNGVVRRKFCVKKASFAAGEETTDITGMQIGGVTPYGLPAGLPIWIDAAVMACDRVIVGGGSRDRKLLVRRRRSRHSPTPRWSTVSPACPNPADPRPCGRSS